MKTNELVQEVTKEFNRNINCRKADVFPNYVFSYKRKQNGNRERIYEYIRGFIGTNGFAPTHREIAKALNIKSPSTIAFHISRLVEDKRLTKHPEVARCLVVPDSEYTETISGNINRKNVEVGEIHKAYSKEGLTKLINECENRIKFYKNLQKKYENKVR